MGLSAIGNIISFYAPWKVGGRVNHYPTGERVHTAVIPLDDLADEITGFYAENATARPKEPFQVLTGIRDLGDHSIAMSTVSQSLYLTAGGFLKAMDGPDWKEVRHHLGIVDACIAPGGDRDLEIGKSFGPWNAQLFNAVSGAPIDFLQSNTTRVSLHGNKGLKYEHPSRRLVNKRFNEEFGRGGKSIYKNALLILSGFRSGIARQQNHSTEQLQEVAYISTIHNLLKPGEKDSAGVKDSELPDQVLQAELIYRVMRLEEGRRQAITDGDSANADECESALRKLDEELGLKIRHFRNGLIVGRQSPEFVLEAHQLGENGLVIKKLGPEPIHSVDKATNPVTPHIHAGGTIRSGRARLADRLDPLRLKLAEALNFDCKVSLIAGIETFPLKGRNLKEVVTADPETHSPSLHNQLLTTFFIYEALGLTNEDWSYHDFRINDSGIISLEDVNYTGHIKAGEERDVLKRAHGVLSIIHSTDGESETILDRIGRPGKEREDETKYHYHVLQDKGVLPGILEGAIERIKIAFGNRSPEHIEAMTKLDRFKLDTLGEISVG